MNDTLTIGLQDPKASGKMPAYEFAALIPMLDKTISQERIKQAQLVLVEGWTSERVSRMFDVSPQAVRKSAARVKAQHEEWLSSLATLAVCRQTQADSRSLAVSVQIPSAVLTGERMAYVKEVARVWQGKPDAVAV